MKSLVKVFFSVFEILVVKSNKWKFIPNSSVKMMYILPHLYHGKNIEISDGTIITNGDSVVEIHIDNLKATKLDNDLKNIRQILNKELESLSNFLYNDKKLKSIKAVHGTTVLYPIAKRAGFTIKNLDKGLKSYGLKLWDNILRLVFRKNSLKSRRILREPKECWMSSKQLIDFYIKKTI